MKRAAKRPEVKQLLSQTKLMQLRPEVYRARQKVIYSCAEVATKTPYDIIAADVRSALKNAMLGNRVVAVCCGGSEDLASNQRLGAQTLSQALPGEDLDALPPEMLIGVEEADQVPEDHENCIVCDEKFDTNYSHCSSVAVASENIPLIACRLASVLRYKTISSDEEEAPKFHIVTQIWKPVSSRRWKELCTSLRKNLENPFVSKIHLLLETENCREAFSSLPSELQEKVIAVPWNRRLTYKEVLKYMGSKIPATDFACLANTDIFFDDSIREVWNIDMKNRCLSLLRYEATLAWASAGAKAPEPEIFGHPTGRDDSQDCWIFRAADLAATDWSALNFTLGQAGCDNCFAGELIRRRFTVCNPAMTIKSYHLHESGLRTYSENDRVTYGLYATIAPCGLMESRILRADSFKGTKIKVEETKTARIMNWNHGQTDRAPYERGCSAIFRGASKDSVIFGDDAVVPELRTNLRIVNVGKEAVITREGLIATADGIGFGDDIDISELLWNQTEYTSLSATTPVPQTVFWPTTDSSIFQLGRLAWLASITGSKAVVPTAPGPAKMLYDFIGVTATGSNAALHVTEDAKGPLPAASNALILKPVVEYLRRQFEPIFSDLTKATNSWAFYGTSDEIVSEFDTIIENSIIKYLPVTAAALKVIRVFNESANLVLSSAAGIPYLWCMRPGSTVIDLQPSLGAARMATAAGLKYMPLIFDKESTFDCARIIRKSVNELLAAPKISANRKIFVPQIKDGFHGHSGNALREMIELWAEAGLVERIFHDGVFCWLNAVGDTLLYERDTLEWLEDADVPEAEKVWCQALFANAQHPDGKAWIYWGYSPRLLARTAAAANANATTRTKNLVFYGKIENARQFKVRSVKATGIDWSVACDEFVMPVGGKYLYTQEEYLGRLAESKFGLCLPGTGPKCFREIECMALGTVPIVTPGVDMEGYAIPLQEGVHYLRAETPEEAKRLASEVSNDTWRTMSAACRKYYEDNLTPEAAWHLTEKLIA
jgi:hypothetical protein